MPGIWQGMFGLQNSIDLGRRGCEPREAQRSLVTSSRIGPSSRIGRSSQERAQHARENRNVVADFKTVVWKQQAETRGSKSCRR